MDVYPNVVTYDNIPGRAGLEAKHKVDTNGYIRIAIYGTDHILDWIINSWVFFKKRFAERFIRDGGCHRGWWTSAVMLFHHIEDTYPAIEECEAVMIRGVSMGGAVAEILCWMLSKRYPATVIRIETWNSPSPWSWLGARTFRRLLEKDHIYYNRYAHRSDIVRRLPGVLLGFGMKRGHFVKYGSREPFWKAHCDVPKNWDWGM